MRVAILTTDNRENDRNYAHAMPYFGASPEALLQGMAGLPGLELHVVSCLQQPVRQSETLAENIWYHALHVTKSGWMRTAYQGCVRAVRKKLREIQPDIVHGEGTERDCAMSAVLSGHPNVVTIHGNMAELARLFGARIGSYNWLAAKLEKFALRRTSGVFCNSAYTEALVRPRARRVWRVPNPLRGIFFDAPKTAQETGRPCVLLNVGVISPRKRQLELLDVVETLKNRGLKFEMHFVGYTNREDAYCARFHEQLRPLEAAGFARYLGEMNAKELLARFDEASGLIHFPSEEAFGLVVAEALARNLKFFGANLGGIRDIATGAIGAELFEQQDWSNLTASIANWIEQGHPRPAGADSLMRQRYHPEVVARQHVEIYREVLKGGGSVH